MFEQQNGGSSSWRAPTDEEKFAEFGGQVVGLREPDPSWDRQVSISRIDGEPAFLDLIYRANGRPTVEVRNVRSTGSRVQYGDLANSSLVEFLVNSKSLPGAHRDRGAEHAAAISLHEALRVTEPTSTALVIDGTEVAGRAVHAEGVAAVTVDRPRGTIVVVCPVDQVPVLTTVRPG